MRVEFRFQCCNYCFCNFNADNWLFFHNYMSIFCLLYYAVFGFPAYLCELEADV